MSDAPEKKSYRAPALEKGLDILELLAQGESYSFAEIVQKLMRSSGELFRMVQVLEDRGYIEQQQGRLALTPRLFELGLGQPPVRSLVEIALPVMRQLATVSLQSCHLVLPSRGDMVVVARVESSSQLGFSVRVGYRQPLHLSGSGSILYAFQPVDVQTLWEADFQPPMTKAMLTEFRDRAALLKKSCVTQQPSSVFSGITDIAAPIMRGDRAAAALAVPYLHPKMAAPMIEEVTSMLSIAAQEISAAAMIGDNRV